MPFSMKFFSFLPLAILTISCAIPKEVPPERVYLDEEGRSISKIDFLEKWRNNDLDLARWDYMENGKRKITLSSPLYSRLSVDYQPLLRNLEKITGQEYPSNSVLVIAYTYTDDLCSTRSSNTWNRSKITVRKNRLKSSRKKVLATSENVVYLHLFEEGINLKNKPNSKKEYFFKDKNNHFRNTLFEHPTLCGSYALIKPNGQTLVRNGEYTIEDLISLLQPEVWNSIFTY